jgi:dihydropyrimidinase
LPEAVRYLDAVGKLVIPGGIDPHVHCDWPVHDPRTGGEARTEGPGVVSLAALYGGTTTLVDFAVVNPDADVTEAVTAKEALWDSSGHCNYALHVMVQGKPSPTMLGQLGEAIERGHRSVKVFTTNIWPRVKHRRIDFGALWEIFKLTSAKNAVVAVHAEEDDIVMHMHALAERAGETGFEQLWRVHNSLSEDLSFRRLLNLASHVENTRVYFMHVSAAAGVAAINEYRQRGVAVLGEALPQYLLHTSDDYLEHDGMKYHTYPSLKSPDDVAELWAGLRSGHLTSLATDEICTSYELKTAGRRIDNVVGGSNAVEPRLAIAYSEAVDKRGFSVNQFVDMTSANAARLLGMFPHKGCIQVGADADIVVLDTSVDRCLTSADLHESDYTPWEGWPITAWPVATVLNGVVVVENGALQKKGTSRRVDRRPASWR